MYVLQKNSQLVSRQAFRYGTRRIRFLSQSSRPICSISSWAPTSSINRKFTPAVKAKRLGQRSYGSSISGKRPRIASVGAIPSSEVSGDKLLSVNLGEDTLTYHIAWLRDACPGHCCIDKSTTQKKFQTSDIPENLGIRRMENIPGGGIKITWLNDIPPYGEKEEHISVYSNEFFEKYSTTTDWRLDGPNGVQERPWNSHSLKMLNVPYEKFMDTDDELYQALLFLVYDGIVMIKGVPSNEESVELVAKRIGNLRDSFYGRTWDVKSVPQAKNVAYTSTYLGLHMDLLYMKDPPGLQLLHCLKNTCSGGTALFSDSFNAARSLSKEDTSALATYNTAYHYRNNNEHYYHEHTTLEFTYPSGGESGTNPILKYVNWSPPFQANYNIPPGERQDSAFRQLLKASRGFSKLIEAPGNLYRYDYEEGDCVIFNNRRVLHGRDAFEAEGGERWLRGAYVDTDVFLSRLRVLRDRLG